LRQLLTIAALAVLGGSTAAAQNSWRAEVGVQGGFARVKPAGTGTSDGMTLLDLPGGSFIYSTLGSAALYAIIPLHNKLAVETQLSGSEVNGGGGASFAVARLGLRGDYAVTPHIYAAAGGILNYVQGFGSDHMQLGAQVALGYRHRLTDAINGRIEATFTATDRKALGALDIYGVQLGVSAPLGRSQPSASRHTGNRSWEPAFGVSGGFASMHVVGTTGAIDGVFLPGVGGGLYFLAPVATAPTMFAIIPLGGKLAIEPGLDYRSASQGGGSVKVFNVAARLDYAVTGSWYAAAGGHLLDFHSSAAASGTASGVDFAWGYRFHLVGAFSGRFETNYSLNPKSTKLTIPAINTLSLTFGAMMPLN
jgi:hypothetical protein